MSTSLKERIASRDGVFSSWSTSKLEKSTIEMRGGTLDIPDDDFNFYISVFDISDTSDGKKRKELYAYFDWIKMPNYWFADPFGLSWADDWEPIPGTDFHQDYFTTSNYSNFLDDTTMEESTNTGVGWIARLDKVNDLPISVPTSLGGYGTITIQERSAGAATSSNAYAKYGHDTNILGSASISIKGIGITINGAQYIRATMKPL